MFKDQAKKGGDSQGFGVGEVLLLLSLSMDGLTGAVQVLFLVIIPSIACSNNGAYLPQQRIQFYYEAKETTAFLYYCRLFYN